MNIVFIVMDTQKGDALGCQGYWRKDISPRIDQLAAEGVRFKDFYASGIATGPGFTCLHTGLFCIHHKFYLTPFNKPNLINFDDTIPVAAEFFIDHGYVTAAADNLFQFNSHMKQFVRGYNYYLNCTPTSKPVHHHVTADQVNALALPWLREHARKQPFFMFIHYWEPHGPYNHPDSFRNYYRHKDGSVEGLPVARAKAGYDYVPGWGSTNTILKWKQEHGKRDLYDEEVRYGDYAVGQVYDTLAELGVLDDTCIVLTADHGEALGQHDNWGHGTIYHHTTYLPLIARCPKLLPQGKVVEGYAEHVDVLPTLLDVAGIADERMKFDGRSLLPQIRGAAPGRPFAFIEANPNENGGERAIVEDGWKYIWCSNSPSRRLFNLADDPCELVNLVDKEPARFDAMRKKMEDFVAEQLAGAPDPIPLVKPQ